MTYTVRYIDEADLAAAESVVTKRQLWEWVQATSPWPHVRPEDDSRIRRHRGPQCPRACILCHPKDVQP